MGQDDKSPWESVIMSQYIRERQCNIVPKAFLTQTWNRACEIQAQNTLKTYNMSFNSLLSMFSNLISSGVVAHAKKSHGPVD